MNIRRVMETYNTPDRKWERRVVKRRGHVQEFTTNEPCTFDEMLMQAVAMRDAIDIVDKARGK